MLSETVLTSLISAGSGVFITFITMHFRNRALTLKNPSKSKDRMDILFEGYEKLIKEQQNDIDRKTEIIKYFEQLVEKYRKDIKSSEDMIGNLKDQIDSLEEEIRNLKYELETSQIRRQELENQLIKMKKEYKEENTVRS